MITRKIGPAIAAGCPCIVKPDAETPLTALAFAELGRRAGLLSGALSFVTSKKHTVEVGKVLTEHPEIQKFLFTGSTAVGKLLASQCTSTLKRLSMELGSNAPVIVFNNADIGKAVTGILESKFRLSGQTCVCTNRAFVQDRIYDKLAKALLEKIQGFKLGPGDDPESTHGPLISNTAVKKVDAHVQDALKRGATCLIGGKRAAGFSGSFYQPTLLTNVPPNSLCAREETFGPLLPLFKFHTEQEVLQLANSSRAGLAGYFFTENVSRVWRIAEELEVGMV
jgi:succinate-semialdehyde dehydrogenase/glutarate-semialdehyde dehydrogenase